MSRRLLLLRRLLVGDEVRRSAKLFIGILLMGRWIAVVAVAMIALVSCVALYRRQILELWRAAPRLLVVRLQQLLLSVACLLRLVSSLLPGCHLARWRGRQRRKRRSLKRGRFGFFGDGLARGFGSFGGRGRDRFSSRCSTRVASVRYVVWVCSVGEGRRCPLSVAGIHRQRPGPRCVRKRDHGRCAVRSRRRRGLPARLLVGGRRGRAMPDRIALL